ncbi:hypothetical protein NL676_030948 [Syzygium grande]|nr:hypothetical protein NL676_030948 [Syzygium grande]
MKFTGICLLALFLIQGLFPVRVACRAPATDVPAWEPPKPYDLGRAQYIFRGNYRSLRKARPRSPPPPPPFHNFPVHQSPPPPRRPPPPPPHPPPPPPQSPY